MKQYKTILFDLDGTLTDPGEGITNSIAYALTHYGMDVPAREELYPFIGPPLTESFTGRFGFSEEKAREAVSVYREYFSTKGIYENKVYDGIPEMLGRLRGAGYVLALATSKPEQFARTVLSHFDLSDYFTVTAGSDMELMRASKADVILYALDLLGCTPDEALMIGDRKYDIIGAAACGIDSLGVTYGYGSEDELCEAGAMYIAHSPEQICELLL